MNPDIAAFLFGAAAGAVPFLIIQRQIARDAMRSAEGATFLRALRSEPVEPVGARISFQPVPIEFVVGTAE